jgi:hypothetical protein
MNREKGMNKESPNVNEATDVLYRDALPTDVPEMADLFLTAVTDLFERNNVAGIIPPREAVSLGYEHVRATGIFRVAEWGNRIVAIAGAVVRDEFWFLSAFWALPEFQRKKIGMPLLRQVWEAGAQAGATTFITWSSIDTTAMASYLKLGMLPGYPILWFEGAPERLPAVSAGSKTEALEQTVALELDGLVRGTERKIDHEWWSDRAGSLGRQVRQDGRIVGYYYLNRGFIGPAAWKKPRDAEAVLTLACREAADLTPSIRFAVPGVNHAALRFALGSGLRLKYFAHLLTTSPFGRMEQYLPSGPTLF